MANSRPWQRSPRSRSNGKAGSRHRFHVIQSSRWLLVAGVAALLTRYSNLGSVLPSLPLDGNGRSSSQELRARAEAALAGRKKAASRSGIPTLRAEILPPRKDRRPLGAPRRDAVLALAGGTGFLGLSDAANAKDTGWVNGRPSWPMQYTAPKQAQQEKLMAPPAVERGMNTIGWDNKRVVLPTAIKNSRASHVFDRPWVWPEEWPYTGDDFQRKVGADVKFWSVPNFSAQLDVPGIAAIKDFYEQQFDMAPQGDYRILDICSSWQSYYPDVIWAQRVAITGLNEQELKRNRQATDYRVKNLNIPDPRLPYEDDTFEFITMCQGIFYLTKPQEVFNEMFRVMDKGGLAIISFTNNGLVSKAIKMWLPTREEITDEAAEIIPLGGWNDGPGHCAMIGNYFRFNPPGGWRNIQSIDVSPDPFKNDPMWIVTAEKG